MKGESPFQLERLDHLVLRTRDVDRLVSFYCGLGCRRVREIESLPLVQLAAGASMIDILGVDGEPGEAGEAGRNLDHFALRISPFDPDAILAFCAANDIEADAPDFLLLGADGYGPAIYIRDPDGNRLELKGPPEKPRPDSDTGG